MNAASAVLAPIGRWALYLLMALLIFWSLLPVGWIILTSFKSRPEILSAPPKVLFTPQLDAYQLIFDPAHVSEDARSVDATQPAGSTFLEVFRNSLVISLGSTALAVILGGAAAYAFSRMRFRGRTALLYLLLAGRLLPPVVTIIPLFLVASNLGLVDTHLALILIYAALNVPFAVWLMKASFDQIPKEVEDAALVDGCSRLTALARIAMPLSAPGVAATAIIAFSLGWNEFVFAFVMTSTHARTVPVLIAQTVGLFQIEWAEMGALATLVIIPVLLFTFLAQRLLIAGLTAGAVK